MELIRFRCEDAMTLSPESSHASGDALGTLLLKRRVTAAELIALDSTPLELLPAPGAGIAYLPYMLNGWSFYNAGSTPFTVTAPSSNSLGVGPPGIDVSTSAVLYATVTLGLLDQAASHMAPFYGGAGTVVSATYENAAWQLQVAPGLTLRDGNGTLDIWLPYSVITVP